MAGFPASPQGETMGMAMDSQKPYGNYKMPLGFQTFSEKYPPEIPITEETHERIMEEATANIILSRDLGEAILPVNLVHALIISDYKANPYLSPLDEVLASSTEILKFLKYMTVKHRDAVMRVGMTTIPNEMKNNLRKTTNTYIKTLKAYYKVYMESGMTHRNLSDVLAIEEYQIEE